MVMDARIAAACLVLAALVAGCPRAPQEPASNPASNPVSKPAEMSGPGLYFELQGKRPGQDFDALIGQVKARLAAFGVASVEVERVGERAIRVRGAEGKPALARRVEQLVTRPSAMAIAPVDPGKRFFEGLAYGLRADGGLRVARDKLGDLAHDKVSRIWYLAADDPTALDAFIAKTKPPAGFKLAPMRGPGGAVAYLVPDPPPLPNPMLIRVEVEGGPDGPVVVVAELARPFQQPFRDLIRRRLNRPLAFLVEGEVVALPVIVTKARRGQLRIEPSPLADPAQARDQAERLATKLRAWQLVGTFKRVGPQKTYPPKPLKDFGRSGLPE